MEDERSQRRYNRILNREYKKYLITERLEQLVPTLTFPPSDEPIKEIEEIDHLRMQARKKVLQGCNKVHSSRIASSPKIKTIRLKLRLLNLLIKRATSGSSAKNKTFIHLAAITHSEEWLSAPLSTLYSLRSQTHQEYKITKKSNRPT
eukprot:530372-Ditylum_brightwellii.AAC.1